MEKVLSANQSNQLDFLKCLIEIDSVNPNLDPDGKGEIQIGKFILQKLQSYGISSELIKIAPNRVNIIGTISGTGGGKNLILTGHMDTVSAKTMPDALSPNQIGGKLYGRGALDMKAGLTSIFFAALPFLTADRRPKGDIILAFVADEEYLSTGTEKFLELPLQAHGAIVTEPTNEQILHLHKGFAWLKIIVHGKAAHGSMPEKGINSIIYSARLIEKIENYGAELKKRSQHPILGQTLIHPSIIRGGADISTIPPTTEIQFEIRLIPDISLDVIKSDINALIEEFERSWGFLKIESEFWFHRNVLETPKDCELVQILTKSINKTSHIPPQFSSAPFWTDAALFSEHNIPAVLYGPKGNGLHSAEEFVEIDSIFRVTATLSKFIEEFCN